MGFFSSLFDISFTRFITTKIIKFLYVVAMVLIVITALVFVAAGFRQSAALGLFILLIAAPLGSLLYLVCTRVLLEFVIQVFRITELLRDKNQRQGPAFANAGWLVQTQTPPECANGGTPTPPGAVFCRRCGTPLT